MTDYRNYNPRQSALEAARALLEYPFPGNVRELINYVEYLSCIASETSGIPGPTSSSTIKIS